MYGYQAFLFAMCCSISETFYIFKFHKLIRIFIVQDRAQPDDYSKFVFVKVTWSYFAGTLWFHMKLIIYPLLLYES